MKPLDFLKWAIYNFQAEFVETEPDKTQQELLLILKTVVFGEKAAEPETTVQNRSFILLAWNHWIILMRCQDNFKL